ncbi:helix-turn-helix domain-containing protein [Actinomycetospora sp. CA-101289]|uniref:helix-turn-helix domain-containing protein n=1 Tax=Actinomycetospora sp. CA-101289 TaxID=3239893 RepID=UPI003D9850A4
MEIPWWEGCVEADAVRRNRELQRRFYGEPLGDRLRRLLAALGVSQTVLADTLGVSPPMLSQLMSGRRVKIGTPAVWGRLVMLEERVGHATGDRAAVVALLAEVRAAEPRAEVPLARRRPPDDDRSYELLRTAAGPDELARAADTLDGGFPSLASLLRRAAGR